MVNGPRGLWCVVLLAGSLSAEVLTVGPNGRFARPCQALQSARDSDVIEIDAAGTYRGDVCDFRANQLVIRGVNGRPHIQAAGANASGKGIWIPTGNNTTIENIEMSGATVPDGNGTPVRLEGVGLTLRRVYFHDSQNGLLTNGTGGDILIEYSEFDRNGDGVGYAHNIYVNVDRSLTVRFSTFRRASMGHLLKSRATQNYIYFNRFLTEEATSSYEIDLPNGGYSVVVGNVIQQGPLGDNQALVGYLEEDFLPGNTNILLMAHNTLINDGPGQDDSGPLPLFVLPDPNNKQKIWQALIVNNIFAGPGSLPNFALYPSVQFRDNLVGIDPMFVSAGTQDYRLLEGSPAIGAAGPLPEELLSLLTPRWQPQAPSCGQRRAQPVLPSLGAFEFGAVEVNLSEPCTVQLETLAPRILLRRQQFTTGSTELGRVALDGVAPPDGAEVKLLYSHPEFVKGPESVRIAAGEASVPATWQFIVPPASRTVTITAIYGEAASDSVISFLVPVVYQPILSKVNLASSELTGGLVTTGNSVQLAAPAAGSAEVVQMRSTRPDLATVPATVTVADGRSTASFKLTTQAVAAPVSLQIIADHKGTQIVTELRLTPLAVASIALPGRTLGGPARHNGVVHLTAPAPAAGVTLQLASTAPEAISVPAQVSVAGGRQTAVFSIEIGAVSAPVSGEIRATLGDKVTGAAVTASSFSISSLLLSPATISGGASSGTNRVILNSPAPADRAIQILLISADPSLVRPPDVVTIQPGLSSGPFQIVTNPVKTVTRVDVRAASESPLGGTSERVSTLTLRP